MLGVAQGKAMLPLLFFVCAISAAFGRKLTVEELHRLPKLFHLDDYERCLSQREGVYCLGTFEMSAAKPNTIMDLMLEHSKDKLSFNRSLLHRGYCVSERCAFDRNSSRRFERCADKMARQNSLNARLRTLDYCITHKQHRVMATHAPDEGQKLYLYAIYVILVLNILGTAYDVCLRDDIKRSSLLMAWSVPSNWNRLTKIQDGGLLSALSPLQSVRMGIQWIIIFAHSALIQYMGFVHNPDALEKLPLGNIGTLLRNGTSMVQIFFLISSFLTGLNLLFIAQQSEVSFKIMGKWILKRAFRFLPVQILVIGYVTTWWPRAGDGPLWSTIVGKESEVCRHKFWSHVFFMNNLVDPMEPCLIPTWAIAGDMQLFVLSMFLTITFLKLKIRGAPAFAILFAASGILNVLLAYLGGWEPMIKIIHAENLRSLFRHTPSFPKIHTSPWSNMPACFLGLFMAHFYFEQTKKKVKLEDKVDPVNEKQMNSENVKQINDTDKVVNEKEDVKENLFKTGNGQVNIKEVQTNDSSYQENLKLKRDRQMKLTYYFLRKAHIFAIPSLISWVVVGTHIWKVESVALTALYVGMERVVFSSLFAIFLIQLFTFDSGVRRFIAWRGWHAIGRLAFSLSMLHWCVNLTIAAARTQPLTSSVVFISFDWLSTLFYTYLLALPVCLLVELPMQKFLDVLISL